MVSFAPTSAETLADRERYTAAGLTEVACLDCLARVGVRKNSEHMTSIQWTAEAEAQCPDLTRRIPEGPRRSIQGGCPRMAASIEAAVADGSLPVGLGVD
ncbi:hypothetical protein [Nocardioides sp. Kera G14]|uniref:hypothetical protein n=1 Tax=Nocardioides sp. Kera G14 TaxID=2884264 RepID=UPI001D0F6D77|nr:hypothetical protein [Nocardioides sp. Kera G14]UDY22206.1 hypothetical protein LH076_08925 [Nocardioides sp. Kera G14]